MLLDSTPTDAQIATLVERTLAHDPQISVHDLRVQVLNGRVRIQGVAGSLQAVRRAGELVAGIKGVHSVDNVLAVEAPRPATDRTLEQAAQSAAGGIDPRVSVQVSDGIAILRGQLDSAPELDPVVAALETIPGLKGIRRDVTFRRVAESDKPIPHY